MVSPQLRVLVVDDDAGIRDMLALVLGEAGHRVRTSDGRGPVDAADVDVALVDVLLGSRTVSDVMIETPGLAEVPLIVMTAHDAVGSVAGGLPRNAHLLRKPFDLADLERAIDEVVAESAAG